MNGGRVAVSVIVCTRNRCSALVQLLESLSRLAKSGELAWELVVVDNGSTDATSMLLDSFADRIPMRRVFEPRKALASSPSCEAARSK